MKDASNHMPQGTKAPFYYSNPIMDKQLHTLILYGETVEGWEWISHLIPHLIMGVNYLSMLWMKLTDVSKRDLWLSYTWVNVRKMCCGIIFECYLSGISVYKYNNWCKSDRKQQYMDETYIV